VLLQLTDLGAALADQVREVERNLYDDFDNNLHGLPWKKPSRYRHRSCTTNRPASPTSAAAPDRHGRLWEERVRDVDPVVSHRSADMF
jgi:hypothetical protein